MLSGKTTLLILSVTLIVLGFALRAILPQNLFVPWGWPLGKHWYHLNWVAFRVFLVAGAVIGMIAVFKVVMSWSR